MRTAIYLRKSRSKEGEDTAETIARHKSTLLQIAKFQSLDVVKIYEEVKMADSIYSRPEMIKLLAAVGQGKYDAVLCMDLDRLGRGDMQEQGLILETFKASDTKIIIPGKSYDLNDESDETMSEFGVFMARQEYKMIKKRFKRGRLKSVEQGCYISNAPFGYENTRVNKQATLKVNEEESKIVQLIFDLYVNQGKGCQSVAYVLNDMGIKPHRSNKFGRTSVAKILKNPVYTGMVAYNRTRHERKAGKHKVYYQPEEQWIITKGNHPAIISDEIFSQAQKILKGKYHPPSNKGIVENPLAGLVVCGNCKAVMQRRPYLGELRPASLICPAKGCNVSSYLHIIESVVLKQLEIEYQNYQLSHASPLNPSSNELYLNALQDLNRQLKTLQGQKSNLHDLLEQSVYTVDVFTQRMTDLSEREKSTISQIEEIDAIATKKSSTHEAITSIPALLKKYYSLSPSQKNKGLKAIINSIEYKRTKGSNADIIIELKG